MLGAALVAAVVIAALRKERCRAVILLLGIYLAAFVLDSPASIIVLVAACVLEPFEIAFLRNWSKRIGRRTKATTGAEGMIGKRAEVGQRMPPERAPSGSAASSGRRAAMRTPREATRSWFRAWMS